MFNGLNVTDTVDIHPSVTWSFGDGAFKLWNPAKTFTVTVKAGVQTANRILSVPVIAADAEIVVTVSAQTIAGIKTFADDVIITATKKLQLSATTWILESASNVFDFFTNSAQKLRISATQILVTDDLALSATKKLFFDGGGAGDTYMLESAANIVDSYVGGVQVLSKSATLITNHVDQEMKGGFTFGNLRKTFEDFFSARILNITDTWIVNNISGTGSVAIVDGIDLGVRITTAIVANNTTSITLNNIRNFDPARCTIFGIIKFDNSANQTMMGICNSTAMDVGTNHHVGIRLNTSVSNIELISADGTTLSASDSGVARSANAIPFKIVCGASDLKLYTYTSGKWVLRVTKTTNRPTAACQPCVQAKTLDATAAVCEGIYIKVQND